MEPVDKELLKGSTITIILTVLCRQEMYGYEIIKSIERSSHGAFSPKEGTVYPVLHQLEKDGAIASRWDETSGTGTRSRKYYRITAQGKKLLAKKTKEWVLFRTAIEQIMAGATMKGATEWT